MRTLPEFFQGSIAQDFPGILEAVASESRKKKSPSTTPDTKAPPCSVETRFCKPDGTTPDTKAPPCSVVAKLCKKKKKAADFLPAVEGWSLPPAPPAF
jgi:hypothetical protein